MTRDALPSPWWWRGPTIPRSVILPPARAIPPSPIYFGSMGARNQRPDETADERRWTQMNTDQNVRCVPVHPRPSAFICGSIPLRALRVLCGLASTRTAPRSRWREGDPGGDGAPDPFAEHVADDEPDEERD